MSRLRASLASFLVVTAAAAAAAAAGPAAAPRDSQTAVPRGTRASLAQSILTQVVPAPPGPAGPVFPEEEFRAQQPASGKMSAFRVPKIERFALANGIEVYLVERHQLPTVAMQLVVAGGASDDPPGKEGLASMAMTLLGDGTEKLDKIAFREALADLASSVSTGAGIDQQSVSMSTLARNLDATLDLWADTLLRPGMRQDEFDRDIKQRQTALAQLKGSPAGVAGRLDNSLIFGPEHAYGRFATEASIGAITLDECKRCVADHLAPAGAKLYVVGDITRAEIESKVGGRLAGWQGKPKPNAAVGAPRPRAGSIFVVDVPKAPQSVIRLVHLGPKRQAADYFPTSVMSSILGGGFASRINMNIREKHGYAYGARGGFNYIRQAGTFVASASVKSDKTKESIQEMRKEIEGIRAAEATDEEMTREKDGSILALPAQFATGEQILGTYQNLVYFGLPLDYYESVIPKVQAVTKQQVLAAARAHLQPDKLQLLVVGDAKTVLPGIRELIAGKELQGDVVMLDADGNAVPEPTGGAPGR